MDRVFESGAVGSPPSAPASPSSGYTTAGNPATATPATKPGPYWFHQVTEELRKAITDAGITPDHADLTQLSAAISALAKKGGLQSAGMAPLDANTTLTNAEHMGKTVLFNGTATAAFTVTLPLLSTVATGRRIHFHNVSSFNVTVQRQGSNLIYPNGASTTSIIVGPGDTLTLEAYNGASWFAVGGSNQLGAAAVFGSNLSVSGYQKLPSGLIIQWGATQFNSSGYANVTFPISFTQGLYQVVSSVYRGNILTGYLMSTQLGSASASGCQIFGNYTTGGGILNLSQNEYSVWIAIGK